MAKDILTINEGSSTIKFAIFEVTDGTQDLRLVVRGEIEGLATSPKFKARDASGTVSDQTWADGAVGHEACFEKLLAWLEGYREKGHLSAVGHRVVHGGTAFRSSVQVNEFVLAKLDSLVRLAPLHQPHHLAAIRAMAKLLPGVPQIACFDTSFHFGRPAAATRYALPREFESEGVQRYGFHGLSYEYIASSLRQLEPDVAAGRVIAAHLGAGASLCAMRNGQSIDTSTGLTALDGLPMATRSGSIDPGAILYIMREHGMAPADVETLLYNRSGLLGLSGLTGDMKQLLESRELRAAEAVEFFVFRVVREIGALTASLGGLDGLVFAGGIGENQPEIRRRICDRLGYLHVQLNETANHRNARNIGSLNSGVCVRVIATDEEVIIARHTEAILSPYWAGSEHLFELQSACA